MGQLGKGRNNQLAQNGLLYDQDGNVFDLTEWYKTHTAKHVWAQNESLSLILLELKRISKHLESMTEEVFNDDDLKGD